MNTNLLSIVCTTILVVTILYIVTSKSNTEYRSDGDVDAPKYKYGIGYTNPILLRK